MEMSYNLKVLPMKALEARSDTEFVFLENESLLCECFFFFLADKVTPACLFLQTDYHYPQDFVSETFGT